MFWYFGTEIESLLGKKRMAWFLGLITVGPRGCSGSAVVELSTLLRHASFVGSTSSS